MTSTSAASRAAWRARARPWSLRVVGVARLARDRLLLAPGVGVDVNDGQCWEQRSTDGDDAGGAGKAVPHCLNDSLVVLVDCAFRIGFSDSSLMGPMRNHDDAIAFFQTRGFHAGRRAWALGDTVVVGLQPEAPSKDGIQVSSFALWLVPNEGAWDVVSSVYQHERRLAFAALDLACEAALKQLSLQVIEEVCPSCQGRLELRFGERIIPAGNRWYQSTWCRDCGQRTEADGGDELPDHLQRIELSRNGRWFVLVASAPPTAGWAVLQKTLGLDLRALAEMRRRVPGVVVEGTFAQAYRLYETFNRHCASAKIIETLPLT